MTLADRIREAILNSGKRPADVARETGLSTAAIAQLMGGATKSLRGTTAAALEKATGYRATWLSTGEGSKLSRTNIEPGPELRVVPVISWIAAGSWDVAHDPLPIGEAERWLPCPVPHSETSFALEVRGDSMTAPYGRSYPEGSVIFVDPALRSPVNGQRIVARLEGSDDVTFKVYKEEDGRKWLQPLNPMHQPIRDPFYVIGTVIGKWEDE